MSNEASSRQGRIAVIGAGSMGAGIAQVAAGAGHEVVLVDAAPGAAERGLAGIRAGLETRVAAGKAQRDDVEALLARIALAADAAALPECAVVIEAIVERLDAKQSLFGTLAAHQPADTILATNTSSLSIAQIGEGIAHPERVVGLHFFNPAPVMRLVEVVRGPRTGEDTLAAVTELVRSWGKTPVQCLSTPGFIVNRVARPFYGEAQRMAAAGLAEPAAIDAALRAVGFSMGPFELTDLIGQDVNLAVGTSVWEQTDHDPRYEPTDYQRELVAAGRLGRKSGAGVYDYPPGPPQVEAAPAPDLEHDAAARTLAMLVNEAVDLVHRGEATAEDVDLAMRLGTGYPKGPIEWGREIGFARVAAQLAELDARHPGGRYRPSPALATFAKESA